MYYNGLLLEQIGHFALTGRVSRPGVPCSLLSLHADATECASRARAGGWGTVTVVTLAGQSGDRKRKREGGENGG
jgi:electron transfer flavoprotein alpha/beta subunit